MEEMYEVLKFIEHGAQCRQSMDCEKGDLLIYYLRENRQMEKETLFEWFRQIGISADQFHRCRGGRRYRYLNPCSIVVAEDGRVYLLDLEAPENESVMKKMQQRAIRKHFVKTASGEENGLAGDPDLFGYGRTMQFVLAYTAVVPQLTRREEKKLERIIERCTEFTRNRYSDIRQAANDIPSVPGNPGIRGAFGRKTALAAAGGFAAAALFLWQAGDGAGSEGRGNEELSTAAGRDYGSEEDVKAESDEAGSSGAEAQVPYEESSEGLSEEEYISGAGEMLKSYLLQNTEEGNAQVVLLGSSLERELLRSLAAAYERQEMTEEAILAYGRLLEIEEGTDRIEAAAEKKMSLEAGQGQYAQAVLTGEEALMRAEHSEKIRTLTEEYRQKQNGEEKAEEKADEEQPERRNPENETQDREADEDEQTE